MIIYKILRILNNITAVLIALLALFMLIRPLLPDIIFALHSSKYAGYAYNSAEAFKTLGDNARNLPAIPADNWLVIPTMHVNAKINEGDGTSTLDFGIWRRPLTSTPNMGGNTVLTAHRYLKTSGPNTFYQLNRLSINDTILVYWEGKEYVYKVYNISEVTPDQIDIEYNTSDSIITLYSCTPLWTSEKRLVAKALLQ